MSYVIIFNLYVLTLGVFMKSDQRLTSPEQLLRKTLISMTIEASSSKNNLLDAEDKEILTSYGLGNITLQDMTTFFRAKARRIQEQIEQPQ